MLSAMGAAPVRDWQQSGEREGRWQRHVGATPVLGERSHVAMSP